jgi:hypothetical protein
MVDGVNALDLRVYGNAKPAEPAPAAPTDEPEPTTEDPTDPPEEEVKEEEPAPEP